MRVLQIAKPFESRIINVDLPKPKNDEVLVRVKAVAMCNQWDLRAYRNEYKYRKSELCYPLDLGFPGHEGSGIVEDVGKEVSDIRQGQRIAMTGEGGRSRLDLYAEYVVRRRNTVVKIADSIPFEEAASLELASCIIACFHLIPSVIGKTVAIAGLGPAGLLAVQIARLRGATQITGISHKMLEFAQKFGVDHLVNPRKSAEFKQLLDDKVDIVVDCTGSSASIENSIRLAANHVVLFGPPDRKIEIDGSLFWKGLTISNAVHHLPDALKIAAKLLESGRINTKMLITKILPLEDYAEGISLLENKKAVKVIFVP